MFKLKMNLQHFAEEQNDPEVSEPETPTVEEPEKTPTSEGDEPKPKTFTQADIDDILAKRLERERKKYSDYEDLKNKASEYEKKLEEQRLAELSEKERAEEIAKKAEEEKSSLQKQLEELQSNVKREKIHNEFFKLATAQNIQYVDDAIKLADLSAVTFDEDGKVVGVEDVVKALVESKPFLVAQPKQPKTIGEGSNRNSDKAEKTADQLLKEAAEKARLTGKPEDKMAYAKLKRELQS